MLSILITFLAGFVSYLTINHFWLAVIGENFYKDKLRAHTLIKKNHLVPYVPAVLCLLFVAITWVLVITLRIATTPQDALLYGCVLGFGLYSFHNLFNLTLLKEHSWELAIVDTIYGTIVLGIVSVVMFYIRTLTL